MTAFSAALDAFFADPNMAEDAVWTPSGGAPVPLRAIRTAPDASTRYRDAQILSDSTLLEVRIIDAPTIAAGDTITLSGVAYLVQGAPERDALRLIWTLELVPA